MIHDDAGGGSCLRFLTREGIKTSPMVANLLTVIV